VFYGLGDAGTTKRGLTPTRSSISSSSSCFQIAVLVSVGFPGCLQSLGKVNVLIDTETCDVQMNLRPCTFESRSSSGVLMLN